MFFFLLARDSAPEPPVSGPGVHTLTDAERLAVAERLRPAGATLAVSTPGDMPLLSDYDAAFLLRAHPDTFPNATGGQPEGMSETTWSRISTRRWPMEQMSTMCQFDMLNILQRHAVNTRTTLHMRAAPHVMEQVASLSPEQYGVVLDLLTSNVRGAEYADRLNALSQEQRALAGTLKFSGAHALGSPASFRSARSKKNALWQMFGPYTTFFTYNPSELHCESVFAHCGRPYGFDGEGRPDEDRPHTLYERWKIVAANPIAMALFLSEFLDVLREVGFGWSLDEKRFLLGEYEAGTVMAMFLMRNRPSPNGVLIPFVLAIYSAQGVPVHGVLLNLASSASCWRFLIKWRRVAAMVCLTCTTCSLRPSSSHAGFVL